MYSYLLREEDRIQHNDPNDHICDKLHLFFVHHVRQVVWNICQNNGLILRKNSILYLNAWTTMIYLMHFLFLGTCQNNDPFHRRNDISHFSFVLDLDKHQNNDKDFHNYNKPFLMRIVSSDKIILKTAV